MQQRVASATERGDPRCCLDVAILSVATAVPEHTVAQNEAFERAKRVFPHLARMEALYNNTGVETRYACEPYQWCQEPHGWEDRTATFQRHALALLEEVAVKAVQGAGLALGDVDMLVV